MNRYVIVCDLKGVASNFHNKITEDVCSRFNKKRQKLPAHITLKAPFETDKIYELIPVLEKFANKYIAAPIEIKGYGKFRQDVIYMNVKVSEETKKMHDDLFDELNKIPWISFKKNEGKDRVFHCTIVSKSIGDKFYEIWDYLNQFPCDFHEMFNNISLYEWKDNTWVIYKVFKLKNL
ncbi:2'-5' RNA ligase family protein [Clostridium sp. DJ247]|uniref:2'-5' RNA ligase family protein n=1 Tax=Clostridium sp. DJ247 TaxID=2726188 RepID=UPI0016231FE8|nr:2'-5' RNA ligase family protein [Clostridium sp. DJ247]MBC2581009.1 2'-5' RNA ligase family protein [Clostridium sp. DJ247]